MKLKQLRIFQRSVSGVQVLGYALALANSFFHVVFIAWIFNMKLGYGSIPAAIVWALVWEFSGLILKTKRMAILLGWFNAVALVFNGFAAAMLADLDGWVKLAALVGFGVADGALTYWTAMKMISQNAEEEKQDRQATLQRESEAIEAAREEEREKAKAAIAEKEKEVQDVADFKEAVLGAAKGCSKAIRDANKQSCVFCTRTADTAQKMTYQRKKCNERGVCKFRQLINTIENGK